MQPLEKSANSWMWNACWPGSRPDTLYVMVVGSVPTWTNEIVPTALFADSSDASQGLPFGATEQLALTVDMVSEYKLIEFFLVIYWSNEYEDEEIVSERNVWEEVHEKSIERERKSILYFRVILVLIQDFFKSTFQLLV